MDVAVGWHCHFIRVSAISYFFLCVCGEFNLVDWLYHFNVRSGLKKPPQLFSYSFIRFPYYEHANNNKNICLKTLGIFWICVLSNFSLVELLLDKAQIFLLLSLSFLLKSNRRAENCSKSLTFLCYTLIFVLLGACVCIDVLFYWLFECQ